MMENATTALHGMGECDHVVDGSGDHMEDEFYNLTMVSERPENRASSPCRRRKKLFRAFCNRHSRKTNRLHSSPRRLSSWSSYSPLGW